MLVFSEKSAVVVIDQSVGQNEILETVSNIV